MGSRPRHVLDGFGMAVRSVAEVATPRSVDELAALFAGARADGRTVGLRGSGRSYGDAALNDGGLVLDMRQMRRVLAWDPGTGVVDVEPGVTIEDLWRGMLGDGWWPMVVPGTMFPTVGGCVAMNVHGKNHWKVGGTGDHVQELDLLTPRGEHLRLSRSENADLFHATIGGFGMLGTVTRLRLQLKRVESGLLSVRALSCRDLDEQFAFFEEHTPDADYCVSWVDCVAGGSSLGRGQAHRASYVYDDPKPDLLPAHQDLPGHILGVPRGLVSRLLGVFNWNGGMRLMNLGKYLASRATPSRPYRQGHVAFAFLLDYVPNWRMAYWPGGFVQYQPFVPKEHAPRVFREILRVSQARGMPSYLGVLKRHRPDGFLLSHALDGYSFALDFPVRASTRAELWAMLHEFSDMVVDAGGRFYPAKDAVIRPDHFRRAWGQERVTAFRALRTKVDPDRVLRTDWATRVGVDEVGT
jgi:FAD/FMN-containing dehydrogenase